MESKEVEDNVSQSMHHLTIRDEYSHPQLDESGHYSEIDTSVYQTDSQASSGSESSNGDDPQISSQAKRRSLLNDFLRSCNAHTVGSYKKRWEAASERTRASHVSKAKSVIVSGLNVIAPGDAGYLWEAVKKSGSVEKVLGIGERQEDRKYLKALAESYQNASTWETRRQILSIMAGSVLV